MRRKNNGRIRNIAADTMMRGTPRFARYVSFKGGVVSPTRAIAKELGAFRICLNAVAPGLTTTDAMRSVQWGTICLNHKQKGFRKRSDTDDLVGTVLFFASSESDFITGQCIVVNGGDNFC